MSRKPIEVETRSLLTPRERVWDAIKRLQKDFTVAAVQDACMPMVSFGIVKDYMDDLGKAGYICRSKSATKLRGSAMSAPEFYLVEGRPHDAPRLSNGKPVVQGLGTLAMWRAMRVLKVFDYHQIADAASMNSLVVRPSTAKTYLRLLAQAGYLAVVKPGTPGTATSFRLLKNTGPHAPAITRRKCVFDRNTGSFAELETAQEVVDGLDA